MDITIVELTIYYWKSVQVLVASREIDFETRSKLARSSDIYRSRDEYGGHIFLVALLNG